MSSLDEKHGADKEKAGPVDISEPQALTASFAELTTILPFSEDLDAVLPDFDDPNIDKDEALEGVLGKRLSTIIRIDGRLLLSCFVCRGRFTLSRGSSRRREH